MNEGGGRNNDSKQTKKKTKKKDVEEEGRCMKEVREEGRNEEKREDRQWRIQVSPNTLKSPLNWQKFTKDKLQNTSWIRH